MEQFGLQNALETTRYEVQAECDGKRIDAAREVMDNAEMASGHPSSEERRRQLHRLWKRNLPMLHIVHAHQEEAREAWEVSMRQVPAGKYYSNSLMARAQKFSRREAGKHPLEQILRQHAPSTAPNDDWF
ncbi:hypothetical protein NQZ79_g6578 [Umbelopsis isabellina]|nr:hypothetical protein NQZ79_g6578 [Umbelopsis isabellina]